MNPRQFGKAVIGSILLLGVAALGIVAGGWYAKNDAAEDRRLKQAAALEFL